MWKNIAIVVVALLIIREINLMNASLTISPDAKKVVAEDKTTLSYVISFFKHEKALFFKETKPSAVVKKEIKKMPTLDDIQPIIADIKTLQELESNNSNPLPKETKKRDKKVQKKGIKNLEIFEKRVAQVDKSDPLPSTYQSAEEKVFAILQQMGKR